MTERRVLLACVLGAVCFAVGFLAAVPRLHAGSRRAYAPPEIRAAARSGESEGRQGVLAPTIRLTPFAAASAPEMRGKRADSDTRSKRKKRTRRIPRQDFPASEGSVPKSNQPVVIYAPSPSPDDAAAEAEREFRREAEQDPDLQQ
jgi:hypothetical protein